jgi:two-component system, chemotaxis family, chemotaxis protein CheY
MRVLVVDDSSTMRRMHRQGLQNLGALEIVEARDGREALELFRNRRFDLIVTDWHMPHMDGLDFVKAIRVSNKTVPVVMITTTSRPIEVIEAIRHGVSDYLIKPFEHSVFRDKMIRWLSRCDQWRSIAAQ